MSKEIDPARARSAIEVVKQHPGMVLVLASPGIVAVVAVWLLAGAGWGSCSCSRWWSAVAWRSRASCGDGGGRSPWEDSAPLRL